MFGYFRPFDSNLTQAETQLFSAHYCRICYCLRSLGGQFARFFTTFDVAVYSMILSLHGGDDPPFFPCQRLGKANMRHFEKDAMGNKLAQLTMISFAEKFRDDAYDGNQSAKEKFVAAFFSKLIKRAQQAMLDLAKTSFEGTERINALQNARAPIDEVLGAYGDMCVDSFKLICPLSDAQQELIRSLSEWIFFVDMACDYNEDCQNKTYNGLVAEGCNTFVEYFDKHYVEFVQLEKRVTDKLVSALALARENTRRWNTLYKIIINAIDNVIPQLVQGVDIKYHYFRELIKRHRHLRRTQSSKKRLGEYAP